MARTVPGHQPEPVTLEIDDWHNPRSWHKALVKAGLVKEERGVVGLSLHLESRELPRVDVRYIAGLRPRVNGESRRSEGV